MKRRIDLPLEHMDSGQDITVDQATVDAIVGNIDEPDYEQVADKTHQALNAAAQSKALIAVAQQLQLALDAANRRPIQRIASQSAELTLRNVFLKANIPTKILSYNFNRSRLLLSGFNANVIMGTDQNFQFDGNQILGDAVAIGFLSATVPWQREVRTIRDIWCYALTDTFIGVQEEFFTGDTLAGK
jgi:hypothetical protein